MSENIFPSREDHAAALAAVDPDRITEIANRIIRRATVEPLAPPRDGLMLLQMRDSVAGAAFHLGEIPVTQVHLRLSDGAREAEGGAALMSDDLDRVTRIAVLDAAHAADWPEAPEIAAMIAEGVVVRAQTEADRALVLERTRVDFQLLTGGEDDAD